MAHYHKLKKKKTGPNVNVGEGHFHYINKKEGTSFSIDTRAHLHTGPDGTLTGPPVPIKPEAFSDLQRAVSDLFGHKPEEVYTDPL